jgi:DNA-binding XRE family transcriptional regulator
MLTEMKINATPNGNEEIYVSVPKGKGIAVAEAIRGVLTLAGHKVRHINREGEEFISAERVFPDASPSLALRGFRGKMEWTQQELAEKLGTTQNCISDMESGKRSISKSMAQRLGEIFDISYKVFL